MDTANRSKSKKAIWKITSILALVLSIIAVCRSFYRTTDLDIDYMGIIIGILAILVTVLATWNIYSAIDANGKIKDFQKIIDNNTSFLNSELNGFQKVIDDHTQSMNVRMEDIHKNVYRTQASIYITATSFEEQIINPRKDNVSTLIIIDMIAVIDFLSKSGNFEEADIRLSYYIDTIRTNRNTIKNGFDFDMKTKILKQLFEIPNRQKLSNLDCFEKEIFDIFDL